jgi:hypothetical protein
MGFAPRSDPQGGDGARRREPATRYYRVMTRDEWMPVLIGEVI